MCTKGVVVELAGTEVPIIWRGRRALAFVPALLADRSLALRPDTATSLGRAEAAIDRGAESIGQDHVVLARLLMRSEGIASSYVEGVQAPVVDVVLAEGDATTGDAPARWVAGNLAAVSSAIDEAAAAPLTVDALCRWHAMLMAGSPVPATHVGTVRTEQGWIGGTSPLDAHLVTPPPDQVPALLDDLVAYVNRDDDHPITQAAVAHAQFELIHPFADGNGRIGRVLIAWILVRRLSLLAPPPVSTAIASDVGGYASGLTLFRLGDHDAWIRWFADAVAGASRTQVDLVAALADLRAAWASRLDGVRRDAAAWRALDLIPRLVLLTSPAVADELAIPLKSASAALRTLATAGILTEHGTVAGTAYRPRQLFVSEELLGLTGATPLR